MVFVKQVTGSHMMAISQDILKTCHPAFNYPGHAQSTQPTPIQIHNVPAADKLFQRELEPKLNGLI